MKQMKTKTTDREPPAEPAAGSLSPAERAAKYRELRDVLGMKAGDVERFLEVHDRTPRRWGEKTCPLEVLMLFAVMEKYRLTPKKVRALIGLPEIPFVDRRSKEFRRNIPPEQQGGWRARNRRREEERAAAEAKKAAAAERRKAKRAAGKGTAAAVREAEDTIRARIGGLDLSEPPDVLAEIAAPKKRAKR